MLAPYRKLIVAGIGMAAMVLVQWTGAPLPPGTEEQSVELLDQVIAMVDKVIVVATLWGIYKVPNAPI